MFCGDRKKLLCCFYTKKRLISATLSTLASRLLPTHIQAYKYQWSTQKKTQRTRCVRPTIKSKLDLEFIAREYVCELHDTNRLIKIILISTTLRV